MQDSAILSIEGVCWNILAIRENCYLVTSAISACSSRVCNELRTALTNTVTLLGFVLSKASFISTQTRPGLLPVTTAISFRDHGQGGTTRHHTEVDLALEIRKTSHPDASRTSLWSLPLHSTTAAYGYEHGARVGADEPTELKPAKVHRREPEKRDFSRE